jgi:hypothetical protein
MFTHNDIGNLFFVIFNNISYNKLEVEKLYIELQFTNSPIDQLIWLVSYLVTWLSG